MPRRPAPSASHRRGFTLIETLMVVAVVGAMMAIVVPRMRVSEATEVQLAAMQLAQDVDLTRTRALSTRSMSRVHFTPGTLSSYSGYLDTNADSTITETQAEKQALQAFGTRPLQAHVKIGRGSVPNAPGDPGSGSVSFANSYVDFDTRGLPRPMGTAGAIYLQHTTDPNIVVAVVISPAGSVRVWTWKSGGWI